MTAAFEETRAVSRVYQGRLSGRWIVEIWRGERLLETDAFTDENCAHAWARLSLVVENRDAIPYVEARA